MTRQSEIPVLPQTLDPDMITATDRTLALAEELFQAAKTDPSIYDEIPQGATLVLLPLNDPTVVQVNVESGLASIERGENVYFLHLRRLADGTLDLRPRRGGRVISHGEPTVPARPRA